MLFAVQSEKPSDVDYLEEEYADLDWNEEKEADVLPAKSKVKQVKKPKKKISQPSYKSDQRLVFPCFSRGNTTLLFLKFE